jgi:hypothetical protein
MESYLRSRRKFILTVSLAFIFGALLVGAFGTTLSLIQTSSTVSSVGAVKGIGVGVYWNYACTDRASKISWGVLDPGSNQTITVYVRNEGNAATTLSKTVQNWNPAAASDYLSLKWNYKGQTISVNQVLQVKLTLTLSPDVTGITTFGFDIVITSTG